MTEDEDVDRMVDMIIAESCARDWAESELAKAKEVCVAEALFGYLVRKGPSVREVALAREILRLRAVAARRNG